MSRRQGPGGPPCCSTSTARSSTPPTATPSPGRSIRDAELTTPVWRLHRLIGMGADQLIEAVVGESRPDLEEGWSTNFKPFLREAVALPRRPRASTGVQ